MSTMDFTLSRLQSLHFCRHLHLPFNRPNVFSTTTLTLLVLWLNISRGCVTGPLSGKASWTSLSVDRLHLQCLVHQCSWVAVKTASLSRPDPTMHTDTELVQAARLPSVNIPKQTSSITYCLQHNGIPSLRTEIFWVVFPGNQNRDVWAISNP